MKVKYILPYVLLALFSINILGEELDLQFWTSSIKATSKNLPTSSKKLGTEEFDFILSPYQSSDEYQFSGCNVYWSNDYLAFNPTFDDNGDYNDSPYIILPAFDRPILSINLLPKAISGPVSLELCDEDEHLFTFNSNKGYLCNFQEPIPPGKRLKVFATSDELPYLSGITRLTVKLGDKPEVPVVETVETPAIFINGTELIIGTDTDNIFEDNASVSFECATEGAAVHYEIERLDQASDGATYVKVAEGVYSQTLNFTESGHYKIKAHAVKEEMNDSEVVFAEFDLLSGQVSEFFGEYEFDFLTNDYDMERQDSQDCKDNDLVTEVVNGTVPPLGLKLENISENATSGNNYLAVNGWKLNPADSYSLTITAPVGVELRSISFAGGINEAMNITAENFNNGVWSGNSREATFTIIPKEGQATADAVISGVMISYEVLEVEVPIAISKDVEVAHGQSAPGGEIHFTIPEGSILYTHVEVYEEASRPAIRFASDSNISDTMTIEGKEFTSNLTNIHQVTQLGKLSYAAVRYGRASDVKTLNMDILTGLSNPSLNQGPCQFFNLDGSRAIYPVRGEIYITVTSEGSAVLKRY